MAPHSFSFVIIQACIAILILVGFESVTSMGEEAKNAKRDIPRAVALSGIISTLGYAVPIIGVILVLSKTDIVNVSGFVGGYQTVVSSALGSGAANVLNGIVGAAVGHADADGFGSCSNEGECEAVCPKEIPISNIARMTREYIKALVAGR